MKLLHSYRSLGIGLIACLTAVGVVVAAPKKQTPIVSVTADGQLTYEADAQGNRVPDFSTCGYAAGNLEIPSATIRVVVKSQGGDETDLIQRAIDYISGLPLDEHGLRGAVLLAAGRHEINGQLQIRAGGVVLRGAGAGIGGTVLAGTGLDRRTLIQIGSPVVILSQGKKTGTERRWLVADHYVPVGADRFEVTDATGLQVGDEIRLVRPGSKEWVERLNAADLGGGEGGGWRPESCGITWDRKIVTLNSNQVALDAPITTALEPPMGGGYLIKSTGQEISQVGVENLMLETTVDAANPKDENHAWFAIAMERTVDAWVRQVTMRHFAGSAVALYETCRRITVEDCCSLEPVSEDGGYRRNTFFTMGQQTLFLRCYSEQGRHDFAVGHSAAGPNAFVQCETVESLGDSGPIESWASGVLFDNVRIDGNALTLGYRPGNNYDIGWAAANSVMWNCSASVIRCWNPPGAQNWSFGSWGSFEGDGFWRDSNNFKKPDSLYSQQLAERTGRKTALMTRATKESSNPSVAEAKELIARSHQPAPSLKDFIGAAAQRNPITVDHAGAKAATSLFESKPVATPLRHSLSLTNGWLVCDGKLLMGGVQELTWWRGSLHPEEAAAFGPALTRFVPGRVGPGYTDRLEDLLTEMAAQGAVALDHHYGLWYDLRRDDHERVRRINGDVVPPFYEQPFARSGQGTAWDGLSKYDLTKYNPWYWTRLQNFAELADTHGLVLFNENYFQHNIIEAGAHWVDCPWRPANNINKTGFPEPPPFAGDKRIFMAEQFYDETDPVRRAYHERFIRQNLDNFTNHDNVIQFTSAEFSGPAHFVAFWLDTIGVWRQEHPQQHPLVALAAPKNVQDTIMADAPRARQVDVIVFRYWYQSEKGLYAPDGGLNLSPRQWQRMLGNTPPTDQNLAAMAAEYRRQNTGKAVMAAGEQGLNVSRGGWAYLCAGGSLPNLPAATDARLLAAVPSMAPWLADAEHKSWVLREPGRQMLIYTGSSPELDLTNEPGKFRVRVVDPKSGEVTDREEIIGGAQIPMPKGQVLWLVKE